MGKTPPRSPLAPDRFPDLPDVAGLRLATTAAGVRYSGRDDVMLAVMAPGTTVAGVFTRSATRAAPVLDCQAKMGRGGTEHGAAFLVNAGNANAFTGRYGDDSVARITQAAAGACGIPVARVFTASTGVIGEPLPDDRITASLDALSRASPRLHSNTPRTRSAPPIPSARAPAPRSPPRMARSTSPGSPRGRA